MSVHEHRVMPRSRRDALGRVLALACALGLLGACAGPPDARAPEQAISRPAQAVPSEAIEQLSRMSARDGRIAGEPPPPPDVLAPDALRAESPTERATRPLEEVIPALAGGVGGAGSKARESVVDEGDRLAALKEYAAGRAMIIDGDARGAERALEEATWLDPDAGPAWTSLGRARLALGKRAEALQALERAVELGERDATALDALGRASLEAGEPARAAQYLAAALVDREGIGDPGMVNVLLVDLGLALGESGYALASSEALRQGLDLPDPGTIGTAQGRELGSIRRRAPLLWTQVGDASVRLGRFADAADAYERAAGLVQTTADPLVARRVYASLAVGRPAEAALAVLDHIVAHEGVATHSDQRLVRYVAEHSGIDRLLARALADVRAWRGDDSPTLSVDLAVAQAHAMTPRAARRLLRDTIERYGPREALTSRLFRTHGGSGEAALVGEAIWLLRRSPLEGESVVAGLFRAGHDPEAVERAVLSGDTAWARLLEAWYWLARYRPERATGALDGAALPVRDDAGFHAARVRATSMAGRWDLTRNSIELIAERDSPEAERALMRSLVWVQRFEEAAEIAGRIADRPEATSRDLLAAARLAAGIGDDERAERWLREAIERDPHDEASREMLISVLSTSTPPDREGATEQARRIRSLRPEGRLVVWLTVRQMLQRGFDGRAEPLLMSLLERDPGDERAFEALVDIWVGRAEAGDDPAGAIDWIDGEIDKRPLDVWLVTGKARILAAAGDAEGAVRALAEAYERTPSPELARLRESLLRDQLGRAAEADELAMARLREGPQSIESLVDLLELLVESGSLEEAASLARESLPDRVGLSVDQSERLGEAVRAIREDAPDGARLALLGELGPLGVPLDAETAYQWLRLIDRSGGVADAVAFVSSISAETARVILEATFRRGVEGGDLPTDDARAQLAYRLGGVFMRRQRGDALELYRAALRIDPSHPLAANDLGYYLLEEGGDPEEIDRLLTTALAGQPENASVLDSVGWLRYRQGVLEDRVGPDGRVQERGALSLLEEALDRAEADREPIDTIEIREHVGDAYWRAGRRDEALAAWTEARTIATAWLRRNRAELAAPTADRLDEQIARLGEKADAARSGGSPAVTPLLGDADGPG